MFSPSTSPFNWSTQMNLLIGLFLVSLSLRKLKIWIRILRPAARFSSKNEKIQLWNMKLWLRGNGRESDIGRNLKLGSLKNAKSSIVGFLLNICWNCVFIARQTIIQIVNTRFLWKWISSGPINKKSFYHQNKMNFLLSYKNYEVDFA